MISPLRGDDAMSDVLIRDVPEEVLTAIDAKAAKLGISRVEYVRRRLAQDVAVAPVLVTVDDLHRFAGAFADLADPDAMAGAWD
jgi:hypothetical protein